MTDFEAVEYHGEWPCHLPGAPTADPTPPDLDDPTRYVRCHWCPTMIPLPPRRHRRVGTHPLCVTCSHASYDLEADR